jgi:predicted amidophosphoribosyltransferase
MEQHTSCPVCGNDQLQNGNYCPQCTTQINDDGSWEYDPKEVEERYERYKEDNDR